MADITAEQINTQLGVAAFDDNAGAGPLTLNLDVLTGDAMTLASNMAEAIFKTLQAASETAASLESGTDTYPAVVRTIQNVNGESKVRLSSTVNTLAPINYESVSSVS